MYCKTIICSRSRVNLAFRAFSGRELQSRSEPGKMGWLGAGLSTWQPQIRIRFRFAPSRTGLIPLATDRSSARPRFTNSITRKSNCSSISSLFALSTLADGLAICDSGVLFYIAPITKIEKERSLMSPFLLSKGELFFSFCYKSLHSEK